MNRYPSSILAATAAVLFLTLSLIAQPAPPTAVKMTDAAQKFLASLSPEQKTKATYPFSDKHRLAWFFTPQQDKEKRSTRVGVRLEEMNADQKTAALALLKTGLSEKGYEQATTIMSLENVLADLEGSKGANTRNPTWYFVTVFGDPSRTGAWGWRFEGHHMSVNYTLDKGEVISATPVLFGANPADVKAGPRKGLRTLPDIEDHARALIKSLTPEQDKSAKQPKEFAEIREGFPRAEVGAPVGVTTSKLDEEQKKTLFALLQAYADRMPGELAAAEMKQARDSAPGDLYFAYWGSTEVGKPYTYRVYGPTFVVEFLNVQADSAKNPANHIHSTWRHLPADLGVGK